MVSNHKGAFLIQQFLQNQTLLFMEGKLRHKTFCLMLMHCVLKVEFFICRCGEDERPLNEVLVLQLGAEHPNGRYNISMCKIFGNHWSQGKRRFPTEADNLVETYFLVIKLLLKLDGSLSIML